MTERQRHRGRHDVGERDLDGARERRRRDELQDHAVHRRRRRRRPRRSTASPPATPTTITGLTDRHDLHLHGAGDQPERLGPGVGAVQRGDADDPVAPAAPTGVTAQAASQPGEGELDRAASDGGSPITGYTVTPYIGATAQTPAQVERARRPARRSPGLTNGTGLHVQGHRDQRRRARAPPRPPRTPSRRRPTIFDFATPATVDSGDTTAVELGVKFKADYDGTITGIRFYKAPANTGTHIGSLWTRRRHAPGPGDLHRTRRASGWQTVDVRQPRCRVTAGTTYVASLLRAQRPLLGHQQRPRHGRRQPAAARPRQLHERQRRLRLRRDEHVPDAAPTTRPTTGSTSCTRSRRPGRSRASAPARPAATSANVTWTAPSSGGPVTLVQDHAVHRLDGADADDGHGHAAGDEHDGHRPDRRHHLHLHRRGRQRQRRGPGVGALQRGHARRRAVVPTAPDATSARSRRRRRRS